MLRLKANDSMRQVRENISFHTFPDEINRFDFIAPEGSKYLGSIRPFIVYIEACLIGSFIFVIIFPF